MEGNADPALDAIRDRVRELIEASGLSRGAFAAEIGLDDSKLSKSLSGVRRFSSLDLASIAEFRHVTVDWLLTGDESPLAMAARASSGKARTAAEAGEQLAALRKDLTSLGWEQPWLSKRYEGTYAALMTAARASSGTYAQQGQSLARAALDQVVSAGRAVTEEDLPGVVEDVFGADVAVVDLDEGFDGLAATSDHAKVIVLGASGNPGRQRFTLAHELCHLLVADDQGVYMEEDIFAVAQGRDGSEVRANAFAASFLMPEDIIPTDANLTDASFGRLACELKVTPSALAIRMRELRLIDSGTCDRWRGISAKKAAANAGQGTTFARRVATASAPRPPGLLLRDCYAAFEVGEMTIRPYAALLGADPDDLLESLDS